MSHQIRRIIIDTDPGLDDAYAILIFLQAEQKGLVKIEAITIAAGNTSLENGCKNIARILEAEDRTDIPVYKGIQESLIQYNYVQSNYHGVDGFGDVFHDQPDLSFIKNKFSSTAICDIVNKNPGEITIVCLAPLTNIALAAKLDTLFFEKVKECYIMGGNIHGKGNQTCSAEFNFYFDPEAAFVVLKKISCPTTLLPLETCCNSTIDISWRHEVLGECSRMAMMNIVERTHTVSDPNKPNSWLPIDSFLAIAMLFPNFVVDKKQYHATVELHGVLTRGQVVLDHLKTNKANVVIIESLDVDFYKNTMLDMFKD
ncbi:hypothetical protein FQA39_LY06697 [Lamprigera yunnana]|nr:hypothetical protein FQA39_LY06697 [Lamprigera yunnana]